MHKKLYSETFCRKTPLVTNCLNCDRIESVKSEFRHADVIRQTLILSSRKKGLDYLSSPESEKFAFRETGLVEIARSHYEFIS